MINRFQLVKRIPLALLIGILLIGIDSLAETPDLRLANQERLPASENDPNDGLVVVEPTNVVPISRSGEFKLLPYKDRRRKWGKTFSISYSMFAPVYYEPNFYAVNFEEIYTSDDIPLIELNFSWKRNYGFGSLGIEFGLGIYENESDVVELPSRLKIYPIRLGAVFAMDNLFEEPLFVPYISGGAYTVHYAEEVASSSVNGFTQASFYVAGGLMMQLNWIDKQAALESYVDSGIENTYLFIEGRKFFASSATKDPDFETDLHGTAGFRVEF
ncbi:MAG: hypothetical protein H6624_14105 [Bdellovibrionaceae bacterium]|nr:hypothetical protein [Bdellovibrionales bacterium]MCB9085475.1 hypothetical protein [Pseudobdellovibrionaceae bacterium]